MGCVFFKWKVIKIEKMEVDRMHKTQKKLTFYQSIYIVIIVLLFLINSEIGNAEMYGLIWDYKFTGKVMGVSISLDGKYIAIGCSDNKIHYINNERKLLWTANTEFPIKDISVNRGIVHVATVDNNNPFDPFGSEGRYYRLNSRGEFLQNSKGASISSFSFSEDGKYSVALFAQTLGSCDVLYFYKEGKSLWNYRLGIGSQGESTVSISSDGNYIAVGMKSPDMFSQKGGIYLLNSTGKIIWEYIISGSHMFNKYLVSISRDGKYIAGGHENSNKLYYLNNFGKFLWEYNSNNRVKAISVSKDGKYVTFCNEDNILYLLNYKGQLLWNRKINNISSVSISGDGNSIVVGSLDNKIHFFENLQIVAQKFINEAKSSISQEKSKNVIISEAESLFTQSENAFKKGDYTKAKDLAEQARNNAIKKSKEADNATSSINEAKSSISQEKSKNVIISEAESLFTQSENAFKKGDYTKAKDLAEQARNNAIKKSKEADNATSSINEAKSSISQEKSKNVIISEADSLFSQSENAFKKGDYTKAKDLAEQARNNAIKISKEADNANSLIDKAKTSIFQYEYSYINNTSIELLLKSLLSQSEDEYKKGNYSEAYLLAQEGYKLAIDIDQDGALNKNDFAPTIKNIYIYICITILFLSLTVLLFYANKQRIIVNKRKECERKLKKWENEGYIICKIRDKLFKIKNLNKMEDEFKKIESKMQKIELLKKKLNSLGLKDIVKFYFSDRYSMNRKNKIILKE